MSSASSSVGSLGSSFVPTYTEDQKKKIVDLATKFTFYVSENPDTTEYARLADVVISSIAQNVNSIQRSETVGLDGRTVVVSITHDKTTFPLIECGHDMAAQDAWKGEITFLDSCGDSLFSYMARRRNTIGLQRLMECNLAPHMPDKKGNYPVHWMAKIEMVIPHELKPCEIECIQPKAKNHKTPGHKSASVGHNSQFISECRSHLATYAFTKKEHKLRGTTWEFPPIFVALVNERYQLVGDLLIQEEESPLRAIQQEPQRREVGLFELAMELGCFFRLMGFMPFKCVEKLLDGELLDKARNLDNKRIVEYLTDIQTLLNVKNIDRRQSNLDLSLFSDAARKHPRFAKWILQQECVRGQTLLGFLSTYRMVTSEEMVGWVQIHQDLGVPISSDVKDQLGVQENSPPIPPQNEAIVLAQNLPVAAPSLVGRIGSIARFILKPWLALGVVVAVAAVAILFFRPDYSNKSSFEIF